MHCVRVHGQVHTHTHTGDRGEHRCLPLLLSVSFQRQDPSWNPLLFLLGWLLASSEDLLPVPAPRGPSAGITSSWSHAFRKTVGAGDLNLGLLVCRARALNPVRHFISSFLTLLNTDILISFLINKMSKGREGERLVTWYQDKRGKRQTWYSIVQ